MVDVNKLIDVLKEAGYDPKPYSGRGMKGKECVAIMGDLTPWEVARALWFNNFDGEDLDVPEPAQDSMGLDFVLYWPRLEWPNE
jgi:hypothetical protein